MTEIPQGKTGKPEAAPFHDQSDIATKLKNISDAKRNSNARIKSLEEEVLPKIKEDNQKEDK